MTVKIVKLTQKYLWGRYTITIFKQGRTGGFVYINHAVLKLHLVCRWSKSLYYCASQYWNFGIRLILYGYLNTTQINRENICIAYKGDFNPTFVKNKHNFTKQTM